MQHDEYWKGRWQRNETGWHQKEVEPLLIENFASLEPSRVLVPLCGKSLDLGWLAARGHHVIGIELAAQAAEAFFVESGLPYQRTSVAGHDVFEGGRVKIHNANVFDLTAEALGPIDAVYDRAALIALPPEVRSRYAANLMALIQADQKKPGFRFLEVVLERRPADSNGPPFSVGRDELERLYGARFRVRPLGREQVAMGGSDSLTEECVYELERLGS